MMNKSLFFGGKNALMMVVVLLAEMAAGPAVATDIFTEPVTNNAAKNAPPNIMLLMNTSGSMAYSHMPDQIEGDFISPPVGYKNFQCNSIYYNPNTTYALPVGPDGSNLPDAVWPSVRYNYYSTNSSMVDISANFQAYDLSSRSNQTTGAYDLPQAAYYYIYSGPETLIYSGLPCTQADGGITTATAGGGTWTRKLVSATSGIYPHVDERQNFARWYVYYRTRMSMVKTSLGLAFAPITSSYRVGFISADPGSPVAPQSFFAAADFTTANKAAWYTKIYAQIPAGPSSMREGLARVGRYYANKHDGINLGMDGDPVQYSCQNNYTMMTTDGYWNVSAETAGPVQLDGSTLVGNQDGAFTGESGTTPYGVWDGGSTTTVITKNQSNAYTYGTCTSSYVNQSTQQTTQDITGFLKSTTQQQLKTDQWLQTTRQYLQSTNVNLQSTSQTQMVQQQTSQKIVQNLQSSVQNNQSQSQSLQVTFQSLRTDTQNFQLVNNYTKTVSNTYKSTSQTTSSTSQVNVDTQPNIKTTTQNLQSTNQYLKTISFVTQTQSTPMTQSTTQQVLQYSYTTQLFTYSGLTELSTPSASCTANPPTISCFTATTASVLATACTATPPSSGNSYVQTHCTQTPVASCSGTGCLTLSTGPTANSACVAAAASSTNGYTSTSCTAASSVTTNVVSCTAGTIGLVTTTCPTPAAAVTVASPTACVASGPTSTNGYITTTCPAPVVTTNVPIPGTCVPVSTGVAPNYITTTCPAAVVTGPISGVACTAATGTSPNYITTSCALGAKVRTHAASCAASSTTGASVITCPAATTTGPTVGACTAGTDANFITTTCGNTTAVQTAIAAGTCVASVASSSNTYTNTTCPAVVPVVTGLASACTSITATSTNGWTTTTCSTPNTVATAIASTCVAQTARSSNSWTGITCPATIVTQTQGVACPGTALPLTVTTCGTTTPVNTPMATSSCLASSPTAANSYTTTQCTATAAVITPIQNACGTLGTLISGPTATNSYTTTTCAAPVTTTNVGISGTCVPVTGTSPLWTTVTCPPAISTSVPISATSCLTQTAASGNQWIGKSCSLTINTSAIVNPTSCSVVAASSLNNWTATTCPATLTTNVPVQSCAASGPLSTNNWVTTTCPAPTVTTAVGIPAACVPVTATSANGWSTTTCPAAINQVNVPVQSCANQTAAAGNNYANITCQDNTLTTNVATGGCTPIAAVAPNWISTSCPTNNTPAVAVATCQNIAPTATNGYQTTTCTASPSQAMGVPVLNCTPGTATSSPYLTTTCHSLTTGPTVVLATACNTASAGSSNNYTNTSCSVPISGQNIQISNTNSTTTQTFSGALLTGTVPNIVTTGPGPLDSNCYVTGGPTTLPALPTTQPAFSDPSCTAWPCVTTAVTPTGSSNSLADVAQYYYINDLRPEMPDNASILSGIGDNAPWQHMTTFGLALGVSGTLPFDPNYLSPGATGVFSKIRPPQNVTPAIAPTMGWPMWPDPNLDYASDLRLYNNPKAIDDFWHATVDGRGQFFSAGNASAVVTAVSSALATISAVAGAGSGAAVSNTTPVIGDSYLYAAIFKSGEWSGDVLEYTMDLSTGGKTQIPNPAYQTDPTKPATIDAPALWSLQASLDLATSAACDDRKIYIRSAGAPNNVANFSWNSKSCATGAVANALTSAQQAYFGASVIANLNQYSSMTDGSNGTVDQRSIAAGANLVNFIRGQRGLEVTTADGSFMPNNLSTLYRKRAHVLGDVADSLMAFVKAPSAAYTDAGYSSFKTAQASRTPMIYVGANDGMLHAIYAPISPTDANYAKAGKEAWAYIPQAVMPNLYLLADTQYSTKHQFYVDGTPSFGDIYDKTSASWKTILVGGLSDGGKGYYAMDITDPANPKSLWEFNQSSTCYNASVTTTYGSDCNLGLSFGRPVITKLVNGTWVVLLTSGYNNVQSPAGSGDGHGYLYVLNAATGQIISKIDTGVGDSGNSSGLREINNYVANAGLDNTTLRVYGGDLLGNVWRFDVNDNIDPPGLEAALITTLTDASGTPQPITTRVQLAEVNGTTMVVAATGQFLGNSDLKTTQVQSVYGFTDTLAAAVQYPHLRSTSKILTLSESGNIRTAVCSVAANCAFTTGWIVDLPQLYERVNVDPFIVGSTVTFASNIPSSSACIANGTSWLNYVDLLTGGTVPSSATGESSVRLPSALVVGLNYVVLSSGQVISHVSLSSGQVLPYTIPVEPPSPIGRRVSWREISK